MDRLRSALASPGSARLVGTLVALVGVVFLIVGVVALGAGNPGSSGAAPAPSTVSPPPASPSSVWPSATRRTTSTAPATTAPPPATVAPPPATAPRTTAAARAPLTVLNNSVIRGLADRAAGQAQDRGWQVAQVGNFAGRLTVTTVYYTPGDAAGEAAARELAREFGQIGQILPRYAGLPPTPAGIVLVVTKDW